MNFDNFLFRASQAHFLTVGNIGLNNEQKERKKELELRKTTYYSLTEKQEKTVKEYTAKENTLTEKQKKELNRLKEKKKTLIGLTPTMTEELNDLAYIDETQPLPKTMQTELRKIYRSTKYNRKFLFTNKYVQKGISQEEESFTTYQQWLKKVKGIDFLLLNNKVRIENDFFTGETDCNEHFYNKFGWGFDIKTSWSIETFPFKEDKLDDNYFWQNQVYMNLTGIKKWKTVYVLVNATEDALHKEKMKYFYAYEMHQSERNEEKYKEVCRDLEKLHIVDYDRFVFLNPGHELEITRDEWHGNNWDIPLIDRVLEKELQYSESKINFLKNRVKIAREELNRI
jgi:hypothetical protein